MQTMHKVYQGYADFKKNQGPSHLVQTNLIVAKPTQL